MRQHDREDGAVAGEGDGFATSLRGSLRLSGGYGKPAALLEASNSCKKKNSFSVFVAKLEFLKTFPLS